MGNEKQKLRILKEISEQEEEYKWGGSEDSDGTLEHGEVDFDKIREEVLKIK